MTEFNAILVEGLFYEQAGIIHIEKDTGEHVSVEDVLSDVLGQRVQFALHHLPPDGIDPDKPGAGSCKYPDGKGCPALHDRFPDRLMSFHLEGVLRGSPWRVEKFDGTVVPIPFKVMPGHYGRLGAATVIDVEKMKARLMDISPEALAAAGIDTKILEGILDRLRAAKGKG